MLARNWLGQRMHFHQLKRRDFTTLLSAAVAAWTISARGQQRPPLIAVLGSGSAAAPSSVTMMRDIRDGMRMLSLLEGRDYVFEGWWADSDSSRFPALADAVLVSRPAAVLVGTVIAAKVLQERSRTVPIVMTGVNDPVVAGLVSSLARPGGNITGVSNMAGDIQLKVIELARDAMPGLRTITTMVNPTNPTHGPWMDILRSQADALRISIGTVAVAAPTDLDNAFSEIAAQRPDALFVLTDNSLLGLSETIIARALTQRIPAFGAFTGTIFAKSGGLFSYSRDQIEAYHAVARFLKQILGGANPADLPIEQPTKFKLFINLKTAVTLGIEIPSNLLVRADEVIE
jgi:putative tryptophan/tyrosine transport system substrate-binding protein